MPSVTPAHKATPRLPRRLVIQALAFAVLALALVVTSTTFGRTDQRGELAAPVEATPALAAAKSSTFRVSTLNLHNKMSTAGMRADINKVIRQGATVIGMQERRKTKDMVSRALPNNWGLAMFPTAPGADDNPIAYNRNVWTLRGAWPRVLTKRTWFRDGYGKQAVHQYATIAVLQNKRSGHVIRATSFHMPSSIQARNGGPKWGQRDRVEAFWRMSAQIRAIVNHTPANQQFIGLCDCNVSERRDRGNQLLKGKLTRPLNLSTQYAAAGYRTGWRIDYVMAQKGKGYRITNWWALRNLVTDHPGVVTEFRRG